MAQHQRLTGPTAVNTAATFTSSMVDGSHPDSPRLFLKPRLGWSVSQPTHTDAPFTSSMVAGWRPDTSAKIFLGPKLGWSTSQLTPVAAPFSLEMVAGWHPDRSVLGKPRPVGWQTSQLTFDLFSIEMVQGWQPVLAVLGKPFPQGWSISQPTHVAAPFSAEMVRGWMPESPRLFLKPRLGWQDSQTTFDLQMTAEMFAGWHPDQARLFLGPRLPQPLSQTTHASAAFSVEMTQGSRPDQARPHMLGKAGWTTPQLTFVVQMTPDMFAGWHPDTFRQRLAPRIPLPLSQTTHVSAPFSHEMVQGAQPARNRVTLGKQIIGWIQGLIDGLFGTQAVRPVGRTVARELQLRTVAHATASVLAPYENAVIADGATYYWRLEEASGSFLDVVTGGSHDLTPMDGTDFTLHIDGIRGGFGLRLGASHGRSRLLSGPTLTAPYSLEAWLIPGAGRVQSGEILGAAGTPPPGLFLETDGTLRFAPVTGVSGLSQAVLNVGALAHVVVTVSASVGGFYTIQFYVNGALDTGGTFTTAVVPSMFVSQAFNRSSPTGVNTLVVDLIDELAMYGVELTAAQVAAHYSAGIGPTQPAVRQATALSNRTVQVATSPDYDDLVLADGATAARLNIPTPVRLITSVTSRSVRAL